MLVESPKMCLVFIIFIIILQQLDGNVIGPLVLADTTGLSSFWILFAILVGGNLFGFKGMVLGVPAFACIYAWIRRFMRGSLTDKQLSTDTDDYINLDYIDSNNVIHIKTVNEKISFNNEKRYTQIALNDNPKDQTDENDNSSVKDTISGIFNKVKTYNEKILSRDKSDEQEDEIVIPLDTSGIDETKPNEGNNDI